MPKSSWSSILRHNYLLVDLLNLFVFLFRVWLFFYSTICSPCSSFCSVWTDSCLSINFMRWICRKHIHSHRTPKIYDNVYMVKLHLAAINIRRNFSQRPLNFRARYGKQQGIKQLAHPFEMLSKFLLWHVLLTLVLSIGHRIGLLAGAYLFGLFLTLSARGRGYMLLPRPSSWISSFARASPRFFLCFPSISLEINYAIIFNIYGIQQRNSSHLLRIYSLFLHFSAQCVCMGKQSTGKNRENMYSFLLFSVFFWKNAAAQTNENKCTYYEWHEKSALLS